MYPKTGLALPSATTRGASWNALPGRVSLFAWGLNHQLCKPERTGALGYTIPVPTSEGTESPGEAGN